MFFLAERLVAFRLFIKEEKKEGKTMKRTWKHLGAAAVSAF